MKPRDPEDKAMQEIIVRYPGDLDATGTFDAAVDKIAAGGNPE